MIPRLFALYFTPARSAFVRARAVRWSPMGLNFEKIMVIMLIALFLLGPDRLPVYAKKLGELVRNLKRMADGAKDRLKDEMGPEFDEVDWRQLDPRQYDPRRIIRDALVEDEREAHAEARRARIAEASAKRSAAAAAGPPEGGVYFDEEAT